MLRVCRSAIPASCITLADLIIQVAAKVVIMQEALRVVVAEDEALIRMDVVATLQEAGYEVVGEAGDGEEAVKARYRIDARPNDHGHQDAEARRHISR